MNEEQVKEVMLILYQEAHPYNTDLVFITAVDLLFKNANKKTEPHKILSDFMVKIAKIEEDAK